MTIKTNHIERYYDSHEVLGGEDLNQSFAHFYAIQSLTRYLNLLFYGKKVGLLSRVNIKLNRRTKEGPDLAVIYGLDLNSLRGKDIENYQIGEHGPAPKVVFEITSALTWQQDLEEKPAIYQKMSVKEYFIYGPKGEPVWNESWNKYNGLVGWRKSNDSGKFEILEKDEFGHLWSEELASWVIADEKGLRLYNPEYETKKLERITGLNHSKSAKLAEKLREMGINPEELL